MNSLVARSLLAGLIGPPGQVALLSRKIPPSYTPLLTTDYAASGFATLSKAFGSSLTPPPTATRRTGGEESRELRPQARFLPRIELSGRNCIAAKAVNMCQWRCIP
jgi:hypothetical protein